MTRKVCVLGGSGFVGSYVCDELSNAGHDVRIFDIVESQWCKPSQEMVIGDLLDGEALSNAIKGCGVVYNFAGLADLEDGLENPLLAANQNIIGNIGALQACLDNAVERYIYASTVYVYSRTGGFYRCSKQAAEIFIEEFQNIYGIDFSILRFGSLYGPRSDKRNGLYSVVERALKYGRVSYAGSEDAMREYVHVEDAALASVAIMDEKFKNRHVVLTGQEPMKVEDMLKTLSEILGLGHEVEFSGAQDRGHYVRTPYAYKPRAGRKYIPPMHVDLGQGLLELIEYVSSRQDPE